MFFHQTTARCISRRLLQEIFQDFFHRLHSLLSFLLALLRTKHIYFPFFSLLIITVIIKNLSSCFLKTILTCLYAEIIFPFCNDFAPHLIASFISFILTPLSLACLRACPLITISI